jgi:hypothetical protein
MAECLTSEIIETFLLNSGYTELSLRPMRPKYDRIIRRMRERGFGDLSSDMAVTELDLIILQMRLPEVRRDYPETEHHLRNATRVRSGGKWKA